MNKLLVILIASFMLSACSLTKPVKLPNVNKYTLNEVNQSRLVKIPSMKTIFVAEPFASPGYQYKDMVYFQRPYDVQTYSVNEWIAPPTQMLLPLIVKSFQQSGFFAGVVSAPHSGATNYRINTRLNEFAQFFDGDRSMIKLSIGVVLIENKAQKILAERDFTARVTVADKTPYGAVVAANKATADVLQQVTAFTVRVLNRI